jgi:hypothetical protein
MPFRKPIETILFQVGLSYIPLNSKSLRQRWETRILWERSRDVEQTNDRGLTGLGPNGIEIRAAEGIRGQIWGYRWMSDENGKLIIDQNNGLPIKENEKSYLGSLAPEWRAIWQNTFRFSNLSIGLGFELQKGGNFYAPMVPDAIADGWALNTSNREGFFVIEGVAGNSQGEIFRDTQSQAIDNNVVVTPSAYFQYKGNAEVHEPFVYDGSYFRLRELSLDYRFSSDQMSKLPFSGGRVGVSASNLWFFAPGMTFENGSKGLGLDLGQIYDSHSYGIARYQLPASRRITIVCELVF